VSHKVYFIVYRIYFSTMSQNDGLPSYLILDDLDSLCIKTLNLLIHARWYKLGCGHTFNRRIDRITSAVCISDLVFYVFCVVLCVGFCTGHFVIVPLNLTYLQCLQHSLFKHLFNLYYKSCVRTATIFVAEIGEPPNAAQTNWEPYTREDVVQLSFPWLTRDLVLKKTRKNNKYNKGILMPYNCRLGLLTSKCR